MELIPAKRIVQAWQAKDWGEGVYSIARFELSGGPGETQLSFDHTGFPEGDEDHLAAGWHTNYWEPMQKYLAR